MTVVWISDTNYHNILGTLSFNFSKNYCSFEKLYPKLHSVFHPSSTHLEVGLKKIDSTFLSDETDCVSFWIYYFQVVEIMDQAVADYKQLNH